jgi:uncharacterized membrane protein
MGPNDRLDALERRLATLEAMVRAIAPAPPLPPVSPSPVAVPAPASPPAPPVAAAPTVDSEQWLGQRGLLALGVFALILAAGYFLKLSFDRGWISPLARCVFGGLIGLAVATFGWQRHGRGMRRYGAALIGAGAGIAYLAVWAATRLYSFLPTTGGAATLAALSLWLALVAFLIDVEWLGATAALGGLLAPVFLGPPDQGGPVLLGYLGVLGLGLGGVAVRGRWRFATALVALACFGLLPTVASAGGASPTSVALYGAILGTGAVYVALRENWPETRLLGFAGGWSALVLAAGGSGGAHQLVLLGALVLSVPVWRTAIPKDFSQLESLYFYLTPVLLSWAVGQFAPAFFAPRAGLATAVVAAGYLLTGYATPRLPFALVGTTALLIATLLRWPSGLTAVWLLLVQAIAWAALDHPFGRTDGRWYSLMPLASALFLLAGGAAMVRAPSDPAFVGAWAALLWAGVATLAALAAGLWKQSGVDVRSREAQVPMALWVMAGGVLLAGVTAEITRYVAQSGLSAQTKALAGSLAVSAWWILFAGGLVLLGFRRRVKETRVAGLVVAALAALKVVVLDLSSLDALYRVASVLILGVVSLGMAHLYNRQEHEV